jgi:hypothetical protein
MSLVWIILSIRKLALPSCSTSGLIRSRPNSTPDSRTPYPSSVPVVGVSRAYGRHAKVLRLLSSIHAVADSKLSKATSGLLRTISIVLSRSQGMCGTFAYRGGHLVNFNFIFSCNALSVVIFEPTKVAGVLACNSVGMPRSRVRTIPLIMGCCNCSHKRSVNGRRLRLGQPGWKLPARTGSFGLSEQHTKRTADGESEAIRKGKESR